MINVEFPADDNDDGDEDDDGSGGEKNASPRDGSVDGSHFEFDFTLLNRAGKRYHFSQNEQRDIQEINIPRHTAEYLPKWVAGSYQYGREKSEREEFDTRSRTSGPTCQTKSMFVCCSRMWAKF